MDYGHFNSVWGTHLDPQGFVSQFAFGCNPKRPDFWDLENPLSPGFPLMRAETNFTCQVVYIYLYSTFQLIVLSSIPYAYDRFVKTEKEKAHDKARQLERIEFLHFKVENYRRETLTMTGRPTKRAFSELNQPKMKGERISNGVAD